MTISLNDYRQALLKDALRLLWRQWTLLGVPGHDEDQANATNERRIIDPESLLLITSELGRFDARLFDEAVNWLRQYGKLINIQRLRGIQQLHPLGNLRVLSAIASTVLENSRLSKWRAIEALSENQIGSEPLFLNFDGKPLPPFGKPDPNFERFGFFRGIQSLRPDATSPRVERPELLLVKLRALFGVNARAEVIAALLSMQVAHPSALARRIAYLPRSIQELLNEMALSGHIVTRREKGSREKYFSLRAGDWNFLITWPGAKIPQWTDWTVIFILLQDSIATLFSEKLSDASQLMVALRLREIFERHYARLSEAGLAQHFPKAAHHSGLDFLDAFLTELRKL